ncbi:MAG: DNA methyltransferase [Eubacterium sp.]|jgi:adenine-specific DNA-methyltransferase|nr:DNA methyltransferase [Eubacterium sp.]
MGYRYIGSKARIANEIIKCLGAPTADDSYFIDAFSGTGIVASKAADLGWNIRINDMMMNATVVSEAHLLSEEDVNFSALDGYVEAVKKLSVARKEGFIWREYSPASALQVGIERRYFNEDNAQRIDGATNLIHAWKREGVISDKEFSLLLSTLIFAVNDVANIAGTYGCFLSKWTQQSMNQLNIVPLELRRNAVNYSVSNLDVFQVNSRACDVVYFDPPYTKRQYASYYHILETIVRGDEPIVEGVAGLRPWKDNASVFCYKTKALKALVKLVISQKADRVLISYSNDGHIQLDEFKKELEKTGYVEITEIGTIGKYRPNQIASSSGSDVNEYLIEYRKFMGD